MEKYLRDIKILTDSLAAINSHVSNADLIEYTLMGLGTEYESLIAVFMNAPIAPSFDDIRSKFLLQEQRLKFLSSAYLPQHQAFAVAPRSFRGRGRFKGGGSGGRSSQPHSRRGPFSGQVSRPSKGILGDRPTLLPDRSDTDWTGCPDSARSTTDFAIYLGSNLISWQAKKQPT
ncbi:putative mitochondrial protein, partial [Drosera capensis]